MRKAFKHYPEASSKSLLLSVDYSHNSHTLLCKIEPIINNRSAVFLVVIDYSLVYNNKVNALLIGHYFSDGFGENLRAVTSNYA